MKKIFLLLLAAVVLTDLSAQSLSTYQAASNLFYWKNRKPFDGYWQQDVHYSIRAKLDDKTDIIEGSEVLTYQNNSPDTLYEVYFHLYQNAFQPGSYMSSLMEAGKIETTYGQYEAKGLGTEILKVEQNDVALTPVMDNTIMKLNLSKPIMPGQKTEFYIAFRTYFDHGSLRRRMKMFEHDGVKHYDGVHWYPRISVYDRKFGWTTDQHLGKEFYGDFGVFDVELQLPQQYIIEATGVLINEKEAMPEALRKQLDISNFKTYSGQLTQILPANGTFKTWRYHADNVHDFAFTADPSYRIGEVVWNGIRCIALAQEPNAPAWQPTAQFLANVVEIYSKDFGMYSYPKMVAADARDGMEYPMLTLDGGNWPGHKYVIAHEVGHNWFFGQVGNNETYCASLDEGFTQFLTAWSLKKYGKVLGFPNSVDPSVVYYGYMNHAMQENTARLNVHSDHFGSAERHGGGYGQVYYKTATMLYNLQYVLGDALFENAMQHYFSQWKIAHPYWEDFRNSIINYTKVDLNWFFDQWINTTKTIDYSISRIKRNRKTQSSPFSYTVTIKRKGEMQMPVDLRATDKSGATYDYYIPNTWFEKEGGHAVLPKWTGWDILNPTYKATIDLNAKMKNLVIDPSERMADVYRLDNAKKIPVKWWFDNLKNVHGDYLKYHMHIRPDVWYNAVDGLKAGLHWDGNYFNLKHVSELKVWYNTRVLAVETYNAGDIISYKFSYKNTLKNQLIYGADSRWLDGVTLNKVFVEKTFNGNKIEGYAKSIYIRNTDYLFNPGFMNSDKNAWNNFIGLVFLHPYKYFKGNGLIKVDSRFSGFTSDFDYSWAGIEAINNNRIGITALKTRFYAMVIAGNNIPFASAMFLGGANTEQMLESKYTRSIGWFPTEWNTFSDNIGHYQTGGGLNLRGYAAYQATNSGQGDSFYVYSGNKGAAFNAEWDFTPVFKLNAPKIKRVLNMRTYAFGDAGLLWNSKGNSAPRIDAGLGTLLNIQFPSRPKTSPLQLRADFPFFLNRIPNSESSYLAFRWLIGLQKSF